jgi:F0F1-type ATP synthase delta subunit
MAERITTARPYAKAIFALARKATRWRNVGGPDRAAEVVADPRVHALLAART